MRGKRPHAMALSAVPVRTSPSRAGVELRFVNSRDGRHMTCHLSPDEARGLWARIEKALMDGQSEREERAQ